MTYGRPLCSERSQVVASRRNNAMCHALAFRGSPGSGIPNQSRLMSSCSSQIIFERERRNDEMMRYATLALLVCVVGAPPARAQNGQKMNYLGQLIDMTELMPAAAPRDCEAGKEDLAGVMEMQE